MVVYQSLDDGRDILYLLECYNIKNHYTNGYVHEFFINDIFFRIFDQDRRWVGGYTDKKELYEFVECTSLSMTYQYKISWESIIHLVTSWEDIETYNGIKKHLKRYYHGVDYNGC